MIAIIDYGAGNLSSVQKALNFLGADNRITADPAEILAADRVILPGVGAFGDAMAAMRSRGLVDTVRAAADGSRPFLGICLGLQLLFAESEESPGVAGLGIFDGGIRRHSRWAGTEGAPYRLERCATDANKRHFSRCCPE